VEARIGKEPGKAPGALKHCLFKSKEVSIEAKRGVYTHTHHAHTHAPTCVFLLFADWLLQIEKGFCPLISWPAVCYYYTGPGKTAVRWPWRGSSMLEAANRRRHAPAAVPLFLYTQNSSYYNRFCVSQSLRRD
jgi:hypothetical protein